MATDKPFLSAEDWLKAVSERRAQTGHTVCHAMYSSWAGGWVNDPTLMLLPVDDHIVHRGDGVFEALKSVGRRLYQLEPHLDRLERSAAQIHLTLPEPRATLRQRILDGLALANQPDVMVRLYVSRGPGGFTTNPRECVGSQLYIVITSQGVLKESWLSKGVRVGVSHDVLPKEASQARVKSCNYLSNVLMKHEALERGLDFCIGENAAGYLAESATENIALVSADGWLEHPPFEYTLCGTTLLRAIAHAQTLTTQGILRGVRETAITRESVFNARELMMVGTTLDVLPATEFEGNPIGDGKPGEITRKLRECLQLEMTTDNEWTVRY